MMFQSHKSREIKLKDGIIVSSKLAVSWVILIDSIVYNSF